MIKCFGHQADSNHVCISNCKTTPGKLKLFECNCYSLLEFTNTLHLILNQLLCAKCVSGVATERFLFHFSEYQLALLRRAPEIEYSALGVAWVCVSFPCSPRFRQEANAVHVYNMLVLQNQCKPFHSLLFPVPMTRMTSQSVAFTFYRPVVHKLFVVIDLL